MKYAFRFDIRSHHKFQRSGPNWSIKTSELRPRRSPKAVFMEKNAVGQKGWERIRPEYQIGNCVLLQIQEIHRMVFNGEKYKSK